jgi:hypothetical protein
MYSLRPLVFDFVTAKKPALAPEIPVSSKIFLKHTALALLRRADFYQNFGESQAYG